MDNVVFIEHRSNVLNLMHLRSVSVPVPVWVRALAGDNVLCSWERHLSPTVPLSTQEYKWVPANSWGNRMGE